MIRRLTLFVALLLASPVCAQQLSALPLAGSSSPADTVLCNQGSSSPATRRCSVSSILGNLSAAQVKASLGFTPASVASPLITGQMTSPQVLMTDSTSGANILQGCSASTYQCNYDPANVATGPTIQMCAVTGCPYDSNGTHMFAHVLIQDTPRYPSYGANSAQDIAPYINQVVSTGGDYTGSPANDGKSGMNIAQHVMKGAGQTWGYAQDVNIDVGVDPSRSHWGAEFDFNNNMASCGLSQCSMIGTWLQMGGNYKSTVGLYLAPGALGGGLDSATFIGLLMDGKYASGAGIQVNMKATNAFASGGANATAYLASGTYSGPAFSLTGSASALFNMPIGQKGCFDLNNNVCLNEGSNATLSLSGSLATSGAVAATGALSSSALNVANGSTLQGALMVNGTSTLQAVTATTVSATKVVVNAGTTVCFNGNNSVCVYYESTKARLTFTNNAGVGNPTMSLDDNGNLRVFGTVTPSTTP